MRKIIVIIFCFISSIVSAQEYYVQSILELTNDLTARRKSVIDSNGKGCALVRISIPSVNNIEFKSSIVGNPEFQPGEYSVFVPENTADISLSVNGKKYDINFSDFNIAIEDKKCYRVVYAKKASTSMQISKTMINANYDNVVVLIDGVPVGQTPLQLDNISLGKHILSIPNTNGVTMRDTTILFKKDNQINLVLHKEEKKPVIVDMATPGGDSSGWYNIFGTNIAEEGGKKGIVDYAGNIIVPCEFDDIYPGIQNGYYVVEKDGKEGLYDLNNGLIVPCIYDAIVTNKSYTHDDYMPVRQNNKWGVISPDGNLVVPIKYENYPQCYSEAIKVTYKEPGYMSADGVFLYDGTQTIKPRYDCLNEFANGRALFRKFDKTIGFTDIYGNETIIPANYTIGSWGMGGATFASGVFRVKDKVSGKWGYMNSQLELVIPCIYDAISEYDDAPNFNNGIVALKLNEDKLVLDSKGNIIVSCKKNGYNDIEIVELSDFTWNKGCFFSYEGNFVNNNTLIKVVNSDNKCGFINTIGDIVVPCKYEEKHIQWFCDNGCNYFALFNNEEVAICDKQQNELFRLPSNLRILEITDGFIMIKDNESGSYGYLNMKGEILANCIYGYNDENEHSNTEDNGEENGYDMARLMYEQPISEGLAILNIGDRFGFIDNKGNIKVPLIYTAVTPFENGIAYVRQQDGKWKKIYKNEL